MTTIQSACDRCGDITPVAYTLGPIQGIHQRRYGETVPDHLAEICEMCHVKDPGFIERHS